MKSRCPVLVNVMDKGWSDMGIRAWLRGKRFRMSNNMVRKYVRLILKNNQEIEFYREIEAAQSIGSLLGIIACMEIKYLEKMSVFYRELMKKWLERAEKIYHNSGMAKGDHQR
jgi:hypothetical protein